MFLEVRKDFGHAHVEQDVGDRVSRSSPPGGLAYGVKALNEEVGIGHHVLEYGYEAPGPAWLGRGLQSG